MRKRLEMHRLEEMVRLHRMGTTKHELARMLVMSPNTERVYRGALAAAGLLEGPVDALPSLAELRAAVVAHHPPKLPPQQASTVEEFRERIEALMVKGLKPRAIYERFRLEDPAFRGSYPAIKRLWRAMKKARGVQAKDVAIPVDTAPGSVAQVDFGYVGKLYDPATKTLRKAWCFVMVLGFSRHMIVRVVFDQKIETWLALHVEAFAELGGVIETVVPDNLKAAVIRAAFAVDGSTELNRSYRELARFYGFKVDPTPPYDAPKKGKVEAGVKYVKGNFFAGREESDVEELRPELARWTRDIAGMREHGTTHQRPLDVFSAVEKAALLPLPAKPYELVIWKKARLHTDCHLAFGKRLYSAPWTLIGQSLWVRATKSIVAIFAVDDERVATHDRNGPGLRSTVEAHLPEHRRDLRHRSFSYWEERAAGMGDEVASYIHEVFTSDEVLSQLRVVQAIVTHLEKFPVARARAACARASFFGNYTYQGICNILRRALDLQPMPVSATPPSPANDVAPRFARGSASWALRIQEVSRESTR